MNRRFVSLPLSRPSLLYLFSKLTETQVPQLFEAREPTERCKIHGERVIDRSMNNRRSIHRRNLYRRTSANDSASAVEPWKKKQNEAEEKNGIIGDETVCKIRYLRGG